MKRTPPNKQVFVDIPDQYANGRLWQLAIREMQQIARSERFWVGLAGVILLLAVTGPFDTGSRFNFQTLLVYWGVIATGTFFLTLPTCVITGNWCRQRCMPNVISLLVAGMAASVPNIAFVVLFNHVFFDINVIADHGFFKFALQCTLVSVVVVLLYQLITAHKTASLDENATSTVTSDETTHLTALHQRLGTHLGEDIVSLQAQDHYVDVTTTLGHELILLRMVDAERELASLPGMRVHRSWWLAEEHITAVERRGDRVVALLDNGAEIPVSRAKVAKLRELIAKRHVIDKGAR